MSHADEDPPENRLARTTSEAGNEPSSTQAAAQELDWVAMRIATAREGNANISDRIATRLGELLSGPLADHALAKAELAKIAKELLNAVASPRSEEKGSR